ncbi:MAG: molybdenum cofactor guanylyltransferase [Micromonosporaceae bacterium]
MDGYAAVILAGGAARRLDGVDKPALRLGGRPLIDRVLAAVSGGHPRIVVGPARELPEGVLTAREDPPGGGPLAALAAGLALVPEHQPLVALLAADLPFLTHQAVRDLRAAVGAGAATAGPGAASPGAATASRGPADFPEAATYVDPDGRRQFLCAVWRTGPLRRRLAALGRTDGVPLRRLYAEAHVAELYSPSQPPPWYDCDTPEQLRYAEAWLKESTHERSGGLDRDGTSRT